MAESRVSKKCKTCRYWSEMLAQSCGGPVEAVCLNSESPHSGRYTVGIVICHKWANNALGSVDDPSFLQSGEDAEAIYSEYDGGEA